MVSSQVRIALLPCETVRFYTGLHLTKTKHSKLKCTISWKVSLRHYRYFLAVVLKLCASESPGGFKTQIAGLPPPGSLIQRIRKGLRICICNKCSGDADAGHLGTTLWELLLPHNSLGGLFLATPPLNQDNQMLGTWLQHSLTLPMHISPLRIFWKCRLFSQPEVGPKICMSNQPQVRPTLWIQGPNFEFKALQIVPSRLVLKLKGFCRSPSTWFQVWALKLPICFYTLFITLHY